MFPGKRHTILAYITDRGDQPVLEYILGLPEDRQRKAMAALQTAAHHGPPLHNSEKCKKVTDTDFYELKPSTTDRIFWVWDRDGNLVVFHAFTKGSNEIPRNEVRTGRGRCKEILEDGRSGPR